MSVRRAGSMLEPPKDRIEIGERILACTFVVAHPSLSAFPIFIFIPCLLFSYLWQEYVPAVFFVAAFANAAYIAIAVTCHKSRHLAALDLLHFHISRCEVIDELATSLLVGTPNSLATMRQHSPANGFSIQT